MPNAAVAEAMGISVKGVEKLLASAMKRLRGELRAHGDGMG
jgi:DNA-directed RNA polymerase specialized sigma24 family protein